MYLVRPKDTNYHKICFNCIRDGTSVPDEPYSCSYVLRMVLSKNWQKYHQFGKNWNNFGDFSDNSAVLHITTKLVTEQCKLNMQYCMIHHINQNCSADAKMYHTWLYVKCTMIYDHKCTQFWRSVSVSAALTQATRVRSRRNLNRGGNALILEDSERPSRLIGFEGKSYEDKLSWNQMQKIETWSWKKPSFDLFLSPFFRFMPFYRCCHPFMCDVSKNRAFRILMSQKVCEKENNFKHF